MSKDWQDIATEQSIKIAKLEIENAKLLDGRDILLGRIRARAVSIMCDLSNGYPSWHDAKRIDYLCSEALQGIE